MAYTSAPRDGARHCVVEALECRRLLANSAWVFPSSEGGQLVYQPTAVGDRVIDFSNVGYRDGLAAIPDVPAKVVVRPGKGDDFDRIQSAIERVSAMPLDSATGFRGAVQLARGTFEVRASLTIDASGVVLRGAGDGKGGTRIVATSDERAPLIDVNYEGRNDRPGRGAGRAVTDKYVPVGARSFRLDRVGGLEAGERIVVHRPSTANWLESLGMDDLEFPWEPGTKNVEVERTITRIEGNTVTVDDPLPHSLDRRYGGGLVYDGPLVRRIFNVGIEDVRGDSEFIWAGDMNHASWFVQFHATENAWVRRVTAEHFVQGVLTAEYGSRSITVEDAVSREPVSQIIGDMRYAFNLENGAEKVLVRDVLSLEGRHDFVTDGGGGVHGPNVFVDAVARDSHADSGPHMHYSTGLLFDNVSTDDELNVRNRGDKGTNHGWAAANSVVWSSRAGKDFRVRNPPGAQNWLIGGIGRADNTDDPGGRVPLPNDPGIYDSVGTMVRPRSLYYAQLKARDRYPEAEDREYLVGDIDGYVNDGAADDASVDPAWRAAVKKRAGARLAALDRRKNAKRWVPFSVEFDLAPGERVIGASLSVGLRRTARDADDERVYVDSLAKGYTFKELKWKGLGGGAQARVIDLSRMLGRLRDGRLNVAIQDDVAVDWAILHVRVSAPDVARRALPVVGTKTAVRRRRCLVRFRLPRPPRAIPFWMNRRRRSMIESGAAVMEAVARRHRSSIGRAAVL